MIRYELIEWLEENGGLDEDGPRESNFDYLLEDILEFDLKDRGYKKFEYVELDEIPHSLDLAITVLRDSGNLSIANRLEDIRKEF